MRRTILSKILAATALGAALTASGAPSPAAAARVEAPWCAVVQIGGGNYSTNCIFWTVEQCVPHVISGNRGSCELNPAYDGPPPRKKSTRKTR